jgi:hypothetical protein
MAKYVQHVRLHAQSPVMILWAYLVVRTAIAHVVCQLTFGMGHFVVNYLKKNKYHSNLVKMCFFI